MGGGGCSLKTDAKRDLGDILDLLIVHTILKTQKDPDIAGVQHILRTPGMYWDYADITESNERIL